MQDKIYVNKSSGTYKEETKLIDAWNILPPKNRGMSDIVTKEIGLFRNILIGVSINHKNIWTVHTMNKNDINFNIRVNHTTTIGEIIKLIKEQLNER